MIVKNLMTALKKQEEGKENRPFATLLEPIKMERYTEVFM
jgi:hypothetical protein